MGPTRITSMAKIQNYAGNPTVGVCRPSVHISHLGMDDLFVTWESPSSKPPERIWFFGLFPFILNDDVLTYYVN